MHRKQTGNRILKDNVKDHSEFGVLKISFSEEVDLALKSWCCKKWKAALVVYEKRLQAVFSALSHAGYFRQIKQPANAYN